MKKRTFLFLLLLAILCSGHAGAQDRPGGSGSLPVQEQIHRAFIASLTHRRINELRELQTSLRLPDSPASYTDYWLPYATYHISLYYLQTDDPGQARKTIREGIDMLSRLPDKNAETYALLAHLQNFSIQFEKGLSVARTSMQAVDNAKKALRSDPRNIRAWYVLACNDYHTPKLFGGGKKWKEYAHKAIDSPRTSTADPALPTWGAGDTYALLIGDYLENDQTDKAKETFDTASALYPSDPAIRQYAGRFSHL